MMKIKMYQRGELLIRSRDKPKYCYLILTGCVNLYGNLDTWNGLNVHLKKNDTKDTI